MLTTAKFPAVVCKSCGGTGKESAPGYEIYPCFWCDGKGVEPKAVAVPHACPHCGKATEQIDGERVCIDCTRWEPTDPRYCDDETEF